MKTEDLQHGVIYRLTRDVENPKPDRRGANFQRHVSFYQWAERMPVWPKGMLFRVERRAGDGEFEPKTIFQIENFDGDLHKAIAPTILDWDSPTDGRARPIPNPKWEALIPNLEPAPVSFWTVLSQITGDSDPDRACAGILEALFDGAIVLESDLRRAYSAYRKRLED
jgi:hypothetical protein